MVKSETEKKIILSISRIEKGKPKTVSSTRKLSIASVAEEAGIHRSTIINRYPELALKINKKSGLSSKSTNSDKQRIIELERKLSEAKLEISALNEQLSKAISLQAKELLN